MPGIVVPAAVFLAETLGHTFDSGAHLASHIRRPPCHPAVRLLNTRRTCLPRRQQETHARHARLRLRLLALRPGQSRLLPAQTRPGQTPGPSPHRPRAPPHPHPARHDPKQHPLRPTKTNLVTRRRLTQNSRCISTLQSHSAKAAGVRRRRRAGKPAP